RSFSRNLLKNQKDAGRSLLAPLLSLPRKKAPPPEQIPRRRIVDIGTRSPGKVPSEEPVAMRRPTVLVPPNRTMQLPLTLAGGLRRPCAEVVPPRRRGRLTARVRELQADRNERSGEERKWGNRNRNIEPY